MANRTENELLTVADSMLSDVEVFNRKILGVPMPKTAEPIPAERGFFRLRHMQEELQEFEDSLSEKLHDDPVPMSDSEIVADQADAMVDLIYVAMGTLLEMGVLPGAVFAEVHAANMRKQRGEMAKRPGSLGHDAVKPEGWTPPDMVAACLTVTPEIARVLSPAFLDAALLRATKTEDYDTGLKSKAEYFPLGHASYFQMVHVKTLRLRSQVTQPRTLNHETLRDTLVDLINYASFWVEAIDRSEV